MVVRQRAIQAEAKQERHYAILDAAERLLERSPERIASVAEVAEEAGLAKGTVYLYFPGKEELLLAVHERGLDAFFNALIELLDGDAPVAFDDILALTHAHLVEPALRLPLAARCFGMMAQSIPAAAAGAFRLRMFERLNRAGAGLERHFPALGSGRGMLLLRHSYALIVGLWQMSAGANPACPFNGGAAADDAGPGRIPAPPYAEDIDRALLALWSGTLGNAQASTGRPTGGGQ